MRGLPEWFLAKSPLTMDVLVGPNEQYRAGARDMLTVVEAEFTLIPKHLKGSHLRYSDLQRRGAPATTDRRDALLDWLRQHYRARGYGLSAREIAEESRLYDGLNGRQERCASDLRALERFGLVVTTQRIGGHWRPASRDAERTA